MVKLTSPAMWAGGGGFEPPKRPPARILEAGKPVSMRAGSHEAHEAPSTAAPLCPYPGRLEAPSWASWVPWRRSGPRRRRLSPLNLARPAFEPRPLRAPAPSARLRAPAPLAALATKPRPAPWRRSRSRSIFVAYMEWVEARYRSGARSSRKQRRGAVVGGPPGGGLEAEGADRGRGGC